MQSSIPPEAAPVTPSNPQRVACDSPRTGKESGEAVWRILTAGALGMATVLALLPAAGHDQLWFLLVAQRWLHGAVLYGPEAFDSNTPAIVWLSAIPVCLAERLRLPLPAVAKLLMTALEVGVALAAGTFLRRLKVQWTAAAKWFLAFASVTLFAVVPARDFGQRDLLAALLCLPYVLAAAQQSFPPRMRAAAALAAIVGVCIKPQLALVPLFVEIAALALPGRRGLRRIRWEPALFAGGGVLFLGAIRAFAPLYLTQALPRLMLTYWAIGHLSGWQLLGESIQLHVLLAIVLLLLILGRSIATELAVGLRRTITLLTVAGIAGLAAYCQQGTGWYYQQLPGITFLGAALALQILVAADHLRLTAPRWLPMAAGGLAVLAVGLTLHFSGYPVTEDRAYAISTPDPGFFAGLAPGTTVATLTTSVDDAIEPVIRYHLIWGQRTNNLWLLPAIFRSGHPPSARATAHGLTEARLAGLEQEQRRWMVEDLRRWRPHLVLVERCEAPEVHCQELEDRHDSLLAFYLADPAFREIWAHYALVRSVGPYAGYFRID